MTPAAEQMLGACHKQHLLLDVFVWPGKYPWMSDPRMKPAQVQMMQGEVSTSVSQTHRKGHRPGSRGGGPNVGCLVVGLMLVIFGGVAALLGPQILTFIKQDALVTEGTPAPCTILSVRETNTQVNHRWVYDLEVEVKPEGMDAYRTEVSQPFSDLHIPNLRAGVGCQVNYDPEEPRMVVVTSTGGPATTPQLKPNGPSPSGKPPEVCTKAMACCVKIGSEASSCASLVGPHVTASVCEAALKGMKMGADAKGVRCD